MRCVLQRLDNISRHSVRRSPRCWTCTSPSSARSAPLHFPPTAAPKLPLHLGRILHYLCMVRGAAGADPHFFWWGGTGGDHDPPNPCRSWRRRSAPSCCGSTIGSLTSSSRPSFQSLAAMPMPILRPHPFTEFRSDLSNRVHFHTFSPRFHTGLLHANEAFTYFHKAERDVPYSANPGNRGVSETGVTTVGPARRSPRPPLHRFTASPLQGPTCRAR